MLRAYTLPCTQEPLPRISITGLDDGWNQVESIDMGHFPGKLMTYVLNKLEKSRPASVIDDKRIERIRYIPGCSEVTVFNLPSQVEQLTIPVIMY